MVCVLITAAFLLKHDIAGAKLINAESALYQVLEGNKHIYQFVADVHVGVFDPEAFAPLEENDDVDLFPYEIPEKSFSQHIVFVRDEFLSIETMDQTGRVLHLYVREIGGDKFSVSFDDDRVFTEADVVYPSIILFTKHVAQLKMGLYDFGIAPNKVHILLRDHTNYYQVGSSTAHALIDPTAFRLIEMKRQVQVLGRYYPLTIQFLDWDSETGRIPQTIRFFIKSRLFKAVRISEIRFHRVFAARNRVVEKYRDLFPSSSEFSLGTNYGQ